MRWELLFVAIILGMAISGCVTKTENIVDGVVTVEAGKYVDYKFSAPNQALVSGNFTASGGSGNDIRVLILNETAYTNWVNGHDVSTYYDSGQLTTGSITASVPKGNYYLVYSNTFSTVSSKSVTTKVTITYAG